MVLTFLQFSVHRLDADQMRSLPIRLFQIFIQSIENHMDSIIIPFFNNGKTRIRYLQICSILKNEGTSSPTQSH